MSRAKWAVALAALAAAALGPRAAAAAIPLCVDVRAPAAEIAGLRRLVDVEIARHPSHQPASSDCRSSLAVELFEAGGARYLTAQIDREVPVRFTVKEPGELGDRVSEAVKLCLHNDPVYLSEDITHYSAVQRLGSSLGVRARTTVRLELFEAVVRSGAGPTFAPGLAVGFTRGSGHWQVLGRVHGASWPVSPTGNDRTLQAMVGVDGALTFEPLEKAFWSPYVSAGLGAQFLRFVGRDTMPEVRIAHVNQLGVAFTARAGVRFFRWHGFDLDLFGQGYVPFYLTRDPDGALFGDKGLYTPALQLGIGVGF